MWMGRREEVKQVRRRCVYGLGGRAGQGRWSGAIYVTCAVGNNDWSWQMGSRPKHTSQASALT